MELSTEATESLRLGSQERGTTSWRRRMVDAISFALTRGSLVLVLIALIAVFAGLNGSTFFSVTNLQVILSTQATYAVVALAITARPGGRRG